MLFTTVPFPLCYFLQVRIFWAGLLLAPAFWAVFFLTALMGLKLQWMVLVIIGLTLSTSNLVRETKERANLDLLKTFLELC